MATNAQNKRSLFSTSQAAQLKQRVEGDYELSVVLFTQGKYHEAYTAAVDFIDATHSLPGEEDVLNVMASRLLMGRCKVHQYDFETGYAILTECMNTAMAKFGERSIAVVEALLAQAEYCFLQAIYPSTDTILIKALTILGKLRDSGVRSNLFKSVCGEVVYALCELYITTGLFDRVYVLVKEFDQVIDATLGAEHPNHYFQLVIKGKVLKYQGKYDLARQAFESVISLIVQAGFKEHRFIVLALTELAEMYALTCSFTECLSALDEATGMLLSGFINSNGNSVDIHLSPLKCIRGQVLLYQGIYLEALDLLREAMQGYRSCLGDKHPLVADSLVYISEVLNCMGKVTAATKVLKQAALIYDSQSKRNELTNKSRGYAQLQLSTGVNLMECGRYKDALSAFNTAFVTFTSLAKCLKIEADVGVAKSVLGLASALRCLSQYKKAKGLIGKAGVMIVKLFGETNVRVSECLMQLGLLNSDMGLFEDAQALFVKAHAIRTKELGGYSSSSTFTAMHPVNVDLFRHCAENYSRIGYFEEGLEPLRVAHALSVKMFNKRSLPVAKALYVRAKVISDLGHAADADVMFQASLVMLQEVLGDTENGIYIEVLTKTAECLRLQGRVVDAESALRQVLLISKNLYEQQKHVLVAEALTTLACILLEGKKPLEAKALLEENILPIYEELCGIDHISYMYCRGLLGLCETALKPVTHPGRQTVIDTILNLITKGRVGREHAYLKLLRAGDSIASEEANKQLAEMVGDDGQQLYVHGENKFNTQPYALALPTDKEIKRAENVTDQVLSASASVASAATGASKQPGQQANRQQQQQYQNQQQMQPQEPPTVQAPQLPQQWYGQPQPQPQLDPQPQLPPQHGPHFALNSHFQGGNQPPPQYQQQYQQQFFQEQYQQQPYQQQQPMIFQQQPQQGSYEQYLQQAGQQQMQGFGGFPGSFGGFAGSSSYGYNTGYQLQQQPYQQPQTITQRLSQSSHAATRGEKPPPARTPQPTMDSAIMMNPATFNKNNNSNFQSSDNNINFGSNSVNNSPPTAKFVVPPTNTTQTIPNGIPFNAMTNNSTNGNIAPASALAEAFKNDGTSGVDGGTSLAATNPAPASALRTIMPSPIEASTANMMSNDKPTLRSSKAAPAPAPTTTGATDDPADTKNGTILPKLGRAGGRAYNPTVQESQRQPSPFTTAFTGTLMTSNATERLLSSGLPRDLNSKKDTTTNNNNNSGEIATFNNGVAGTLGSGGTEEFFDSVRRSSFSTLPAINGATSSIGQSQSTPDLFGSSYNPADITSLTVEAILNSSSTSALATIQAPPRAHERGELAITQTLADLPSSANAAAKKEAAMRAKGRSSKSAMSAMKTAANTAAGPSLAALGLPVVAAATATN